MPLSYTVVRQAWRRYCQAAGVEATIHQLRHSQASQLVRAGVPLATVRKQLGHRNIQTTINFYCGLETTQANQAFGKIIRDHIKFTEDA